MNERYPFHYLSLSFFAFPGGQARTLQMGNSFSVQRSHALITCSLFSCWQGVGSGQEPRGVSREQVGNKTVPLVMEREDVRMEALRLIVTMH